MSGTQARSPTGLVVATTGLVIWLQTKDLQCLLFQISFQTGSISQAGWRSLCNWHSPLANVLGTAKPRNVTCTGAQWATFILELHGLLWAMELPSTPVG